MTTTPLSVKSVAVPSDPTQRQYLRVDADASRLHASVDVLLVQWPVEAATRHDLRTLRVPRVLIVAPGSHPPDDLDELEDWLRAPAAPADLEVRAKTVARRAEAKLDEPWVDDDGFLWFRNRWHSLPKRQVEVVRLLVERYRSVVRDDDIDEACGECGTRPHAEAVKTLMRRIQRGIDPLGLTLRRVRGSGYVLDTE